MLNKKRSKKVDKKIKERQKTGKVDPALDEQFQTGRILGKIDNFHSAFVGHLIN